MGFKSVLLLSSILLVLSSSCVSQKGSGANKLLSEGSTASDAVQPLSVPNNFAPTPDRGVSKVASSTQHACALQSGKVSCWGLNKNGQIGDGNSGVIEGVQDPITGTAYTVKVALTPAVVFSADVSDLAVGFEHSCAIKSEELFCWGSNEYGQLGINPVPADSADITFSRPVSILRNVKQVAARGRWTMVVSNTQQLLGFGTRLVLENGLLVPKLLSKTPRVLITSGVASVSMSANHACAIMTSGALKCFGMNGMGEVGNGDTSGSDVANPVEVFADGVSAVNLSDNRSCSMRSGMPFCSGASLGDREVDEIAGGWRVASPTPYAAVFWNRLNGLRKLSASGAAIATTGDLYYGSYFHSSGVAQKVALGVMDFAFAEADAGGCMMFQNHDVKCWGSNRFGQLGTGRRSTEDFTIFKAVDVRIPR